MGAPEPRAPPDRGDRNIFDVAEAVLFLASPASMAYYLKNLRRFVSHR